MLDSKTIPAILAIVVVVGLALFFMKKPVTPVVVAPAVVEAVPVTSPETVVVPLAETVKPVE